MEPRHSRAGLITSQRGHTPNLLSFPPCPAVFRERSFAQISRKRRKTRLLSRTCEVTRFYREHQDSRDCTAERPHEKALLFVKGANVTQRHQHTGEKRRGSLQPYLPARLQGALASDTAACNTNQSAFWTSEMYVNESNEWQAWDVADG